MSAEPATANRVDRDLLTVESLYVVRVQDHVDGRIAGHDGSAYVSPPASRDSALELIGLLLGGDPAAGQRRRGMDAGRARRTAHDHARSHVRSHRLSTRPGAAARPTSSFIAGRPSPGGDA